MPGNNERDLGYLLRAVEDLAKSIKEHMDREEIDREELKIKFQSIQAEINYKDSAVNKRIDELSSEVKSSSDTLKKYMLKGAVLFGIAIASFEKIDLYSFIDLTKVLDLVILMWLKQVHPHTVKHMSKTLYKNYW